ncbi:MAG TPA: hypothetical protein VFC74_07785 [Oscillospiraceae bacterium]|nr:hypothetical protein [Oscillospiraceae bacterium]
MHKRYAWQVGVSMLLVLTLFMVFLSPPGEAVQAFNQSNLIRVTEVREVDGHYYYRRVAPVSEFWP